LILDGKIGKVLELRGRGKEDSRGGGEDLWVLGSHVMNLMHHFGGEPNWCFASVLANNKPITKKDVLKGTKVSVPWRATRLTPCMAWTMV